MRVTASDMNGGVVVIGNAPTALLEVIKMIQEKATKPALIIGIPVGFVSAVESKEELLKIDAPFITNIVERVEVLALRLLLMHYSYC